MKRKASRVPKAIAMRDADSGLRAHPGRIRVMLMLAITWCGVDGAARSAPAWGRMGHRASARLAEARLTPAARAAIRDLLEPGESLADASTWADEHRRDVPESGPWHYVHVPITEPRYDARFCAEAGCIVSKIAEFRRLLADRNAARRPAEGAPVPRPLRVRHPPAAPRRRPRRPGRERPPTPVLRPRLEPAPDLGLRTARAGTRARGGPVPPPRCHDDPGAGRALDARDGRGLGQREPRLGPAGLPAPPGGRRASARHEARS